MNNLQQQTQRQQVFQPKSKPQQQPSQLQNLQFRNQRQLKDQERQKLQQQQSNFDEFFGLGKFGNEDTSFPGLDMLGSNTGSTSKIIIHLVMIIWSVAIRLFSK